MPPKQPGAREFRREYDLDRTTALSDGVFAIAITLLVLSLEVPNGKDLQQALSDLAPQFFSYALSFAVIARFWVLHHGFFGDLRRVDGRLTVLNLAYLAFISFLPFPTELLGNYSGEPLAVTLYAAAVAIVATIGLVMRFYALGHDLYDEEKADPTELEPQAIAAFLIVPATFLLSIPVAYLVSATAGQLTWIIVLFGLMPLRRRVRR